MFKKERLSPFTSIDDVLSYHNRERIPCLECGKPLQFLPRHIWFVHGLSAYEYREKWNIPQSVSLAGTVYLAKRSQDMKNRINAGTFDPKLQVAMMREAYNNNRTARPPEHHRHDLHMTRIRENILENKIWKHSPVIITASPELKAKAVQRMNDRKQSGEFVKDIAADLGVTIGTLYRWYNKAKS